MRGLRRPDARWHQLLLAARLPNPSLEDTWRGLQTKVQTNTRLVLQRRTEIAEKQLPECTAADEGRTVKFDMVVGSVRLEGVGALLKDNLCYTQRLHLRRLERPLLAKQLLPRDERR